MHVLLNKENRPQAFVWDTYILDVSTMQPVGLLLGNIVYAASGVAIGKVIDNALYNFDGFTMATVRTITTLKSSDLKTLEIKKAGWQILTRITSHEDARWINTLHTWSNAPLVQALHIQEGKLQMAAY